MSAFTTIFRGFKPMRTAIIALLLTGAATAAATTAFAQADDNSVPGRVYKLEKEMRAVQRKVFPGGNAEYFEPQISAPQQAPTPSGNPADSQIQDLSGRVSALEQQVQTLTNQAEENSHRLTVLEQQYAKMRDDTQYRLNALEGNGAGAAQPGAAPPVNGGAMPPPPATVPGKPGSAAPFGPGGRKPVTGMPAPTMGDEANPSAPPPMPADAGKPAPAPMPTVAKTGDPAEDQYMLGYTLWTQKRYGEAETQLKQVVAKYPTSKRASYAQNLLGRAYMDDGQLTDAATAFYDGYKKFPRGERAADSLYYLGQTMTKLKKTDRACQVYDELRDVYGATLNATLKARVAQGRADAKCGA
jgi:TolA-binding protein